MTGTVAFIKRKMFFLNFETKKYVRNTPNKNSRLLKRKRMTTIFFLSLM